MASAPRQGKKQICTAPTSFKPLLSRDYLGNLFSVAFKTALFESFQESGPLKGALPDHLAADDLIGIHGLDLLVNRLFVDLSPGGCDQMANAAVVNEGFQGIQIGLRRLMAGAKKIGCQLT